MTKKRLKDAYNLIQFRFEGMLYTWGAPSVLHIVFGFYLAFDSSYTRFRVTTVGGASIFLCFFCNLTKKKREFPFSAYTT